MYSLQSSSHQQEKIHDISNIRIVSRQNKLLISIPLTFKRIEGKLINEG